MKKSIVLSTVLLSSFWTLWAQTPVAPVVQSVTVAPTGSCSSSTPLVQVVQSTGSLYTCDNGTWAVEGVGAGSGTVTSVSVATANGVSGTVATATTTPAITLVLGAITPTSIGAPAATTQSSGDNSTKVATTAYVDATKPVSAAISSATGGSGTGTVTCLTASCTNISGTYSVAGGTFATGNMLVLVWPTTTTAYRCWTSQNGGVATYGVGHSVATATGMTITSGISVTGVTVTIDYGCSKY